MTFQEAANQLFAMGLSPYQIGKSIDLSARAFNQKRRLKGDAGVDAKRWRPAFYQLARERAAQLDSFAVRLQHDR